MRARMINHRKAGTVLGLVIGLIVGCVVGGGILWMLSHTKTKHEEIRAELGKADELAMVPANAMGFVHVRLANLWKLDAMIDVRKMIEKAGPDALKALDEGFIPAVSSIDRATLVLLKQNGSTNPKIVVFLAFSAPFDAEKLRNAYLPQAVKKIATVKEDRKAYWIFDSDMAIHFPTDRLLMIGDAASVSGLLSTSVEPEGPLSPAIKLASEGGKHVVAAVNMSDHPIPPSISREIPPEVQPLMRAKAIWSGLQIGRESKIDIRASYNNDESAAEAEKSLKAAADLARKQLAEPRKKMEEALHGKPGESKPRQVKELPEAVMALLGLGGMSMIDEILTAPPIMREGSELHASFNLPSLGGAYFSLSAMSIGVMLPALQKVREASSRVNSSKNLQILALSMHNWSGGNNDNLPPAVICDKDDAPLLSWRVMVLPQLEETALYQQFHLDEPWDSEHNLKLIPKMPKVFQSPSHPTPRGQTFYKVFVGGGSPFDLKTRSNFNRFPDGTSNTIMIAEAGEPVIWTSPYDIPYDPKKAMPNLAIPGGSKLISIALCDGSVRQIDLGKISEKTLRGAITYNGGEILGSDWR